VTQANFLILVVALVVGPNATLLCKAACERQAPASTCQHDAESTGPAFEAIDLCDHLALSGGAVLLNETRRGVADTLPSATGEIEFTREYQLSASTTDARPATVLGRARSFEDRSLSTGLRI
jgi:hypothetical protein